MRNYELQCSFDDGRLKKKDALFLGGVGALYPEDLKESFELSLKTMWDFMLQNHCDTGEEVYFDENASNAQISFIEEYLGVSMPRTQEQLDRLIDVEQSDEQHMNDLIIKEKADNVRMSFGLVHLYQGFAGIMAVISIVCYIVNTWGMISKKETKALEVWICSTSALLTAWTSVIVTVLFSRWLTRDVANPKYSFYAPAAYVLITVWEILNVYYTLNLIKASRLAGRNV